MVKTAVLLVVWKGLSAQFEVEFFESLNDRSSRLAVPFMFPLNSCYSLPSSYTFCCTCNFLFFLFYPCYVFLFYPCYADYYCNSLILSIWLSLTFYSSYCSWILPVSPFHNRLILVPYPSCSCYLVSGTEN